MREGVTREESDEIRYGLMQFVNVQSVYVEDRFAIEDSFKAMVAPAAALGVFISLMILTLSFFMMTVSFSQKIRELAWEQGVLRAIGLSLNQNNKLFFYEATCIVVASFLTGISVGLLTTLLVAALFSQLTEMPRNTVLPWGSMGFILIIISFATFLAVRVPAAQLNKRQISSVLRGN